MMFGISRCDQDPPALSKYNPETARGFLLLLLAWANHAIRTLLRGKLPELPSFRRAIQFPAVTGGMNYRLGAPSAGGPAAFGGPLHADGRCDPPPESRTWYRVRGEEWRRIGWTISRGRPDLSGKRKMKHRRWKTSDEIIFH